MSLEPGRADPPGADPRGTEPEAGHGIRRPGSMGTRPDPLVASITRSRTVTPSGSGVRGIRAAAFAAMLAVAGILAAVALLAPDGLGNLVGSPASPSPAAALGAPSAVASQGPAAAIPAASALASPAASPSASPAASDILPATASPTEVVSAFYRLVAEHRFTDASMLWTPSMRQRYPPAEYINRRFAHTTRVTFEQLATTRVSGTSAVVSVRFTEYRNVSPTWVRYWGSWDLARLGGRWLLNASNF